MNCGLNAPTLKGYKITQIRHFMKIFPAGAELLNADEEKDTTKLIFAFRNFAKRPNGISRPHCLTLSLFAVLVLRRKTFSFSVVSRRGVRNCSNLAKSIKSKHQAETRRRKLFRNDVMYLTETQTLASSLFMLKVK